MRPHGQTKLGFFPLPIAEAKRLSNWLTFLGRFSALDPCVGDGVAFYHLLRDVACNRYGIEVDANRASQAKAFWKSRHCTPTRWTSGARQKQTLCSTSTLPTTGKPGRATTRDWKPSSCSTRIVGSKGGVLLFVIPQLRLAKSARLLSEQFFDLRVFRLTEPACLHFKQIVVLATRRKSNFALAHKALEFVYRRLGRTRDPDKSLRSTRGY
jgi:hypothetical protein